MERVYMMSNRVYIARIWGSDERTWIFTLLVNFRESCCLFAYNWASDHLKMDDINDNHIRHPIVSTWMYLHAIYQKFERKASRNKEREGYTRKNNTREIFCYAFIVHNVMVIGWSMHFLDKKNEKWLFQSLLWIHGKPKGKYKEDEFYFEYSIVFLAAVLRRRWWKQEKKNYQQRTCNKMHWEIVVMQYNRNDSTKLSRTEMGGERAT